MKYYLKIASVSSLVYALFSIIGNIVLMFLYKPEEQNWMDALMVVALPTNGMSFLLLLFTHLYYFRNTTHISLKDILIISILVIFLSYVVEYLINVAFYVGYFESLPKIRHDTQGILGLIDSFVHNEPYMPAFAAFRYMTGLITEPLSALFLRWDLVGFIGGLTGNRLFYTLILIYGESLFFLFRKYNKEPWLAIVPFLNNWILVEITKKPKWWNLVLWIPFVRHIFLYFINAELAKDVQRDSLYAMGMTLMPPLFYGDVYLNEQKR
ncbi:DUF5684 domain-containing protein [Xanthocytophaga agilis]|uniref:DUF5684 domain-containing protein n=1 Tax=Xanthocytophaga agilis TaxID=3048010 RepID=A0AAE3R1V6_9BACT|nr:DUF5684 domain-containing protein [Xanthocytophaga agilis]MDJ1501560.1 DUF5684 domain-containing protein [Xanthocytophaga agilis]